MADMQRFVAAPYFATVTRGYSTEHLCNRTELKSQKLKRGSKQVNNSVFVFKGVADRVLGCGLQFSLKVNTDV